MKILVIIVSYGDNGDLRECLASLDRFWIKSGMARMFDVCVIDNNKNNAGFAAGVNKGIRGYLGKFKYDWVWLLNPDCVIEVKGELREFKGIYGKKFNIWSPLIYQPNGKLWFGGGKINKWTGECVHCVQIQNLKCKSQNDSEKIKNINTNQCNPIRENPTVLIRENQENSNETMEQWNNGTEWVSGCSMFIRPTVFKKIGLFDEKFFLFYEDVDFCLRAKKAGFRIGVVGKGGLEVIHKVSRSVGMMPEKKKYEIEMESKMYLLKKHKDYFWPTAYWISKIKSWKHERSIKY